MASGELEKSLREEVNRHLDARTEALKEEIERMQSHVNDTFAQLLERASRATAPEDALSDSIAQHIRDAHERGAQDAAAELARTKSSSDVAILKAAVEELDYQRSQAGILDKLVNSAASFAPRVAFFVIRNDQAIGWRARGLEGTVGDDSVRDITLPLSADTVVGDVVASRATWSGTPGAKADDRMLLDKLGGEPPQRMTAIPLVARNRTVAVLYADSAGLDSEAINLEALEMLVRVAGMAVELLAAGRAPAERPARHAEEAAAPVEEVAATEEEAAHVEEGAQAPAEQFGYQPSEAVAEAAEVTEETRTEEAEQAPAEEAAETFPSPIAEEAAPSYEAPSYETPSPEATSYEAPSYSSSAEPAAETVATPPPSTDFYQSTQEQPAPSQYSAPLGSARSYGSREAELPIEVGEDERRLHNDARRFARLLVSEIKLYNEQEVREGRERGDIYERLREAIDRSRQMYDKRVAPPVAARYDYFHQELVNTLAEGDPSKLGQGYKSSDE
ncbi:MAG: hypothetical protein AUG51_00615 [Acidobacteria bacterium 13_1_20CM_3_53_8]|nr:MAG: hypothetical protein AUG51_00615 [Acidobacteria bacterium 13_1_20CM_3_53_8]